MANLMACLDVLEWGSCSNTEHVLAQLLGSVGEEEGSA